MHMMREAFCPRATTTHNQALESICIHQRQCYENTNNVSAAEDIEKMVLEIQEGMLEIQKGMKSHLEQTSEEDTRALLNHLWHP